MGCPSSRKTCVLQSSEPGSHQDMLYVFSNLNIGIMLWGDFLICYTRLLFIQRTCQVYKG